MKFAAEFCRSRLARRCEARLQLEFDGVGVRELRFQTSAALMDLANNFFCEREFSGGSSTRTKRDLLEFRSEGQDRAPRSHPLPSRLLRRRICP